MGTRRDFLTVSGAVPLVALTGCGGDGEDTSTAAPVQAPQPAAPAATSGVIGPYVQDLSFMGYKALSGAVDSAPFSIGLITNPSGHLIPATASTDIQGETVRYLFNPDGTLSSILGTTGSAKVEYRADATLLRRYDANGTFLSGYASGLNSQARIVFGTLTTEQFLGLASLADIIDVTMDVADLNGVRNGTVVATRKKPSDLLLRLLGIRTAYAQTSSLPNGLTGLKDDIDNFFGASANFITGLLAGLLKNVGIIAIIGLAGAIAYYYTTAFAIAVAAFAIYFLFSLLFSSRASAATNAIPHLYGNFSGTDTGTADVTLNAAGKISGTGYSREGQGTFGISGTVGSDGRTTLTASGGASTGATFQGTFTGIHLIGTWVNSRFSESGTFDLKLLMN